MRFDGDRRSVLFSTPAWYLASHTFTLSWRYRAYAHIVTAHRPSVLNPPPTQTQVHIEEDGVAGAWSAREAGSVGRTGVVAVACTVTRAGVPPRRPPPPAAMCFLSATVNCGDCKSEVNAAGLTVAVRLPVSVGSVADWWWVLYTNVIVVLATRRLTRNPVMFAAVPTCAASSSLVLPTLAARSASTLCEYSVTFSAVLGVCNINYKVLHTQQ